MADGADEPLQSGMAKPDEQSLPGQLVVLFRDAYFFPAAVLDPPLSDGAAAMVLGLSLSFFGFFVSRFPLAMGSSPTEMQFYLPSLVGPPARPDVLADGTAGAG